MGADGVKRDLQQLDQLLNRVGGRKTLKLGMAEAQKEIVACRGELEKLKRDQANLTKGSDAWKQNAQDIEFYTKKLHDAQQAMREFQYAQKNLAPATFAQNFHKMSAKVAHLGSALQSAGNAITNFTTPFRTLFSGAVMGAGYKLLNKFTEGFSNGFTRYDTMKKFPKIMEQLGYTEAEAQQAIDKLDASVQGLPVALDDAVAMAQRFINTTGDMTKGTDIAIAANNAFLASMSTETQRYQGMMQLQDVVGGKDMNAKEWQALANSMMPAIRQMGKYLGLEGDALNQYVADVQGGKIANEEFIDTLIKAGTDANGTIYKMAQQSKDTWEAFFSRIGTASSRMVYGVLKAFDAISQKVTGKDVNQLFDQTIIPSIDKATKSIVAWIDANPDKIIDFFNSLKSIDFASFAKGVAEGLGEVLSMTKNIIDFLGGKNFSTIGKWLVRLSWLGRAMTITGGLLKGTRHLWGAVIAGGRLLRTGGLLGMFSSTLFGTGTTVAQGVKGAETIANSAPVMGRAMSGLTKVFLGWAELATMVGGTALVGVVTMKSLKTIIKDMGEIGDLVSTVNWKDAVPAMEWFGAFIVAFGALGTALGLGGEVAMIPAGIGTAVLGALTTFISGVAVLDMKLLKSAFKSIRDITKLMNEAIENLNNIESINGVGDVKTKVKNAITTFNQVNELFEGTRDPSTWYVTGGLDKVSKSSVESMENLASLVTNMKTAIDTLSKLSETDFDDVKAEEIVAKMQKVASAISSTIMAIPSAMKTKEGVEGSSNINSIMSNANNMFSTLLGENGILKQIPKIIGEIDGLIRTTDLGRLKGKMSELGSSLRDAYNALYDGIGNANFAYTNLDNLREALKQARLALHHLNELSVTEVDTSGIDTIKSIIEQLEKSIDDTAVANISESISNFKQSIQTALDTLQDLNGDITIDAEVKLSSGFYSSVSSAVADINKAKRDITKAFNDIPSTLFKTIWVTLTAHVDYSGAVSAINDGSRAIQRFTDNFFGGGNGQTGGLIGGNGSTLYRSRGGSVFKPRGTDTVPAMLTEGEYVHNKKAVDFFGIDFMRRINAMDVRGAMDALLNRSSTSIGIGRQSVVNNTVNNNQRVTQNITTNNPSFASMRAGRFVGAM